LRTLAFLGDLRDHERILWHEALDLLAQERPKQARGHGLGLDGAFDVPGALVGILTWLRRQPVLLDLFLGDREPVKGERIVDTGVAQVGSQLGFNPLSISTPVGS
jgi:hypothetical protein